MSYLKLGSAGSGNMSRIQLTLSHSPVFSSLSLPYESCFQFCCYSQWNWLISGTVLICWYLKHYWNLWICMKYEPPHRENPLMSLPSEFCMVTSLFYLDYFVQTMKPSKPKLYWMAHFVECTTSKGMGVWSTVSLPKSNLQRGNWSAL